MVSQATVRELEGVRGPGAWVLSVYLNHTRTVWPAPRTRVMNAVKALEASAQSEAYRKALQNEWKRVDAWLHQLTPESGRSVALFSSQPLGLWRCWFLQVPVADAVRFEETAYTAPLLDLLDEHERYAVALVEKQRARLFLMHLGQIEEQDAVLTAVPQKHKAGGEEVAGGPSPRRRGHQVVQSTLGGDVNARAQRHHDEVVKRHVRTVAGVLGDMLKEKRFDRLIIGGPIEARTALEEELPRSLQQRLAARLTLPVGAPSQRVLEKSLGVEEGLERSREEALVEGIVTAAAKSTAAVLGLDRTLSTLHQGQAHLLVMVHGLVVKGFRCTACGFLSQTAAVRCAACGGAVQTVDDLLGAAAERGAPVEFVQGKAADRLSAYEGVGAFLTLAPRNSLRARRTARRRLGQAR